MNYLFSLPTLPVMLLVSYLNLQSLNLPVLQVLFVLNSNLRFSRHRDRKFKTEMKACKERPPGSKRVALGETNTPGDLKEKKKQTSKQTAIYFTEGGERNTETRKGTIILLVKC